MSFGIFGLIGAIFAWLFHWPNSARFFKIVIWIPIQAWIPGSQNQQSGNEMPDEPVQIWQGMFFNHQHTGTVPQCGDLAITRRKKDAVSIQMAK